MKYRYSLPMINPSLLQLVEPNDLYFYDDQEKCDGLTTLTRKADSGTVEINIRSMLDVLCFMDYITDKRFSHKAEVIVNIGRHQFTFPRIINVNSIEGLKRNDKVLCKMDIETRDYLASTVIRVGDEPAMNKLADENETLKRKVQELEKKLTDLKQIISQ